MNLSKHIFDMHIHMHVNQVYEGANERAIEQCTCLSKEIVRIEIDTMNRINPSLYWLLYYTFMFIMHRRFYCHFHTRNRLIILFLLFTSIALSIWQSRWLKHRKRKRNRMYKHTQQITNSDIIVMDWIITSKRNFQNQHFINRLNASCIKCL